MYFPFLLYTKKVKNKKLTTKFEELGLSAEIIKALKENGFEAPFPIQQEAIPFILRGIDVIGQAHTGTGKTAAFALPMLTKIKYNGRSNKGASSTGYC